MSDLYQQRDESFGNGRDVRNLFEQTLNNQATRIMSTGSYASDELLIVIEPEDIPALTNIVPAF